MEERTHSHNVGFAIIGGATLVAGTIYLAHAASVGLAVYVAGLAALTVLISWLSRENPLKRRAVIAYSVNGGILFGVIGFLVGFGGVLLFMPGTNDGPLVAVFVTGPLGVFVGALLGAIYGRLRRA